MTIQELPPFFFNYEPPPVIGKLEPYPVVNDFFSIIDPLFSLDDRPSSDFAERFSNLSSVAPIDDSQTEGVESSDDSSSAEMIKANEEVFVREDVQKESSIEKEKNTRLANKRKFRQQKNKDQLAHLKNKVCYLLKKKELVGGQLAVKDVEDMHDSTNLLLQQEGKLNMMFLIRYPYVSTSSHYPEEINVCITALAQRFLSGLEWHSYNRSTKKDDSLKNERARLSARNFRLRTKAYTCYLTQLAKELAKIEC